MFLGLDEQRMRIADPVGVVQAICTGPRRHSSNQIDILFHLDRKRERVRVLVSFLDGFLDAVFADEHMTSRSGGNIRPKAGESAERSTDGAGRRDC